MAAFRDGTRGTVEPKRLPFPLMAKIAAAATDAEVTEAAAYFASLPYRSVVDVVETDTVPRTRIADWHLLVVPGGGEEPIGARIIEIPADNDRFTSRDTRVRFTAFVPSGSIAKGRALATTGGDGRTVVCSTCHGADLKGAGMAPGIAGRSPSYIVRQLFDIREGKRSGANAALMRPTVQHLTLDDMIALTAYVASLRP
jgi:cytochrome c553